MSSRKSVTVTGVVQSSAFKKETSALVTYTIKDVESGRMIDLVCLKYRSDDKTEFNKIHSGIRFGDVVEATGVLRTRLDNGEFISVRTITKVDVLRHCIPIIPLTLYHDKFMYQGVMYKYASVNLSRPGQMSIVSDKDDIEIEICEQGFEHTSFFVKSNKHEDISYDVMDRVPYSVIAGVITGPYPALDANNNFSEIPLKLETHSAVYQGKRFSYRKSEMDVANKITLYLKEGPKIEIVRQGPGHVGVVVYKNEYEEFESIGYDIMMEVNYDAIAQNFI